MSNETVSTWPRIEAVAREDGTGEVVVDGASYPIAEQTLDQARVAIIGRVTETAERLGRPVRVATNGPDGYWPLVVHPNGHVEADLEPPSDPATEDSNPATEDDNAGGTAERNLAGDGANSGDVVGDGSVAPGVPTLPARESYDGSPVPQSPRTALRHPARSDGSAGVDGSSEGESAAARPGGTPAGSTQADHAEANQGDRVETTAAEIAPRDGDNTSRWDQDREDDGLIGELLAGDPPRPDSAVEVTESRRLDWKSVWEPSDRWNVHRTKKEDLPKLRFHESVSMPTDRNAADDQPSVDRFPIDDSSAATSVTDRSSADHSVGDHLSVDSSVDDRAVPDQTGRYTGAESGNGIRPVAEQPAAAAITGQAGAPQPEPGRFTFGRQDPAPFDPSGSVAAQAGAQREAHQPDAANPGTANTAQQNAGRADTGQPNAVQQYPGSGGGATGQSATNGSNPAPVSGYAPGHPQQAPAEPQPVLPEPQPAVPEAPQQRQSFLVQESAEEPASRGFRGLLTRAGIKIAPNELERSERNDMMAVSQHWPGPRTIAIVNGKGGAGKTPTTIMLSAVFALFGGAGVAAWDNNQTRGTLGWRTEQGAHEATLLDLLPEVPRLLSTGAQAADLAHFVHHQTRDRFDVLRSQPMVLAHEQRIEPRDVDAIHSVLGKYYRLIFIDSGNDESDPMWLRMIDHADQLVVATTTRNDHAEAGALLLEALASRDERSARLAQQSIAVITQADSNSTGNDVRRVTGGYQSLTRSTVPIPFDPGMVDGQLLFAQLKPETQRAWLAAAAAVATGL